jgi:hypothetical protein
MDIEPAVFKTVCEALLRRSEWVRFPCIPRHLLAALTANMTATAVDVGAHQRTAGHSESGLVWNQTIEWSLRQFRTPKRGIKSLSALRVSTPAAGPPR